MSDYDTDLVVWSAHQADLLRRMGAGERVNDQVDWENVAAEIESVGKSERRELENRVALARPLAAGLAIGGAWGRAGVRK